MGAKVDKTYFMFLVKMNSDISLLKRMLGFPQPNFLAYFSVCCPISASYILFLKSSFDTFQLNSVSGELFLSSFNGERQDA